MGAGSRISKSLIFILKMQMTPTNSTNVTKVETIHRICCVCLKRGMGTNPINSLFRCPCCKLCFHAKCYGIDIKGKMDKSFLCHLCDFHINLLLTAKKISTDLMKKILYRNNVDGDAIKQENHSAVKMFIDIDKGSIKSIRLPRCLICGSKEKETLYSKLATQDDFVHTACALSLKENKQIITHYIPSQNSFMYSLLPPRQTTEHAPKHSRVNILSDESQYFKVKCLFGKCKSTVEANQIPGKKGKIFVVSSGSTLLKEETRYICSEHCHKDIHESDHSKKYDYIWWLKKDLRNEYKEYYHLERYNNYTHQKENCEKIWDILDADFNPLQKLNMYDIRNLIDNVEGVVPIQLRYEGRELLTYIYGDCFVNCFHTGFSKIVTVKLIKSITAQKIKDMKETRKQEENMEKEKKSEINTVLGLLGDSNPEEEKAIAESLKQERVEEFEKKYFRITLFENDSDIMLRTKKQQDQLDLNKLAIECGVIANKVTFGSLDTKPFEIDPLKDKQALTETVLNQVITENENIVLNTTRNAFIIQAYLAKKNKRILEKILKKYSTFIKVINNKSTREFVDENIPDMSIHSKKMPPVKITKMMKLVHYLGYIKNGFEYYGEYKESEYTVIKTRNKLKKATRMDSEKHDEEVIHTSSNEERVCCCICLKEDFSDENQIVFCEFCDVSVHQGCYGIDMLPPGEWYCSRCNYYLFVKPDDVFVDNLNCVICGLSSGAMKPAYLKGVWCHSVCAFWTPETFVGSSCTLEPVFGFDNVQPCAAVCKICKRGGVGCQPCSITGCNNYMHISCTQVGGGRLEETTGGSRFNYKQYCPDHTKQIEKIENTNPEINNLPEPIDVKSLIGQTGVKFTEVANQRLKQGDRICTNFMGKENSYTVLSEIECCSLCTLQLEEPIIKCWMCDISVHLPCYGEDRELVRKYTETLNKKKEKEDMAHNNDNQNKNTSVPCIENNADEDPGKRAKQTLITDHIKKPEEPLEPDSTDLFMVGNKVFWICHGCLFTPNKNQRRVNKLYQRYNVIHKLEAREKAGKKKQIEPAKTRSVTNNNTLIALKPEGTKHILRSETIQNPDSLDNRDTLAKIRDEMLRILFDCAKGKRTVSKIDNYQRRSVEHVCYGCMSSNGLMKPISNKNFQKWVHIYCGNTSTVMFRGYDRNITGKTFFGIDEEAIKKADPRQLRCAGCHTTNKEFVIKPCPIDGLDSVYYHGNCMQYNVDINIYRNSYNTSILCRIHTMYNFKYFTLRHMLTNDPKKNTKLNISPCDVCHRMVLNKVMHCIECNINVHAKCIYLDNGIERETKMGSWKCDVCSIRILEPHRKPSCFYCKNDGKVLVKLGSFGIILVHPICYKVALKEYCFNNSYLRPKKGEIAPVIRINSQYCSLCHNIEGNVYKCTDCDSYAHLTCAQDNPLNEALNILEFNYLSPENMQIREKVPDLEQAENEKREITFLGCKINVPLRSYLFENTAYKFKCKKHIKPWDIIGLFNVNCHSCGFGRIEKKNPLILCLTCQKFFHSNCYRNLNGWNEVNGFTFKCDECVGIENKPDMTKGKCEVCLETYSEIGNRHGTMRLKAVSPFGQQEVKWCYICDYCERTVSLQSLDLREKLSYIDHNKTCSICGTGSSTRMGGACEIEENATAEPGIIGSKITKCHNWSHFKCEKERFYSTRKRFINHAIIERNYLDFDFCCIAHKNDSFLDCYCSAYIDEKTIYRGKGMGENEEENKGAENDKREFNLECVTCGDRFHPLCTCISTEKLELNRANESGFRCIRCLFIYNT